jgi:hypothetical protein
MPDKKQTVKEFLAQVRDLIEVPKDMDDYQLFQAISKSEIGRAKIQRSVEPSNLKQYVLMKGQEPGAGSVPKPPLPQKLQEQLDLKARWEREDKEYKAEWNRQWDEINHQSTGRQAFNISKGLEEMISPVPVVGPQLDAADKSIQSFNKGNTSEGLGYAGAAALPGVGPMAAGIGEQIGNKDLVGAGTDIAGLIAMRLIAESPHKPGARKYPSLPEKPSELSKFKQMTQRITQPIFDTLSEQAEAIKGHMQGEVTNVGAIKANPTIRTAAKLLGDLESAPGTPKGAVGAARDVLNQMADQLNSGKSVSWNELFELNKKLNAATTSIKDPATANALRKIINSVDAELSASAGRVGAGKVYDTWRQNYAKASEVRRQYENVLRGKTDAQLETKATAKNPKGPLKGWRSTKTSQVATANKKLVEQAHKGFDELHRNIKNAPKLEPKPTPPKPQLTLPPGPNPNAPQLPGAIPLGPSSSPAVNQPVQSLALAGGAGPKPTIGPAAPPSVRPPLPTNPMASTPPQSMSGQPRTGPVIPSGGATEQLIKQLMGIQ